MSSPFFNEQASRDGNIKRIRWGEIAATAIVVATGAAVSQRTGTKLPILASIGICGIFVLGYEYMIANPASDDEVKEGKSSPWFLPSREKP